MYLVKFQIRKFSKIQAQKKKNKKNKQTKKQQIFGPMMSLSTGKILPALPTPTPTPQSNFGAENRKSVNPIKALTEHKRTGYTSNFYDVFITILHNKPLLKRGLLFKEWICFKWEQFFFPFTLDPLLRKEETQSWQLPPLKV